MIDFLHLNYPITRMKVEGRFKRVVVTESVTYILSDNNGLKTGSYRLLEIMEKVFGYKDEELMKDVIGYHLGLR